MRSRWVVALAFAAAALSACSGGIDGGDDDDSTGGVPQIPSNAYCDPVSNWDAGYAQLELEVFDLVNDQRASGADCGSEGTFGPAPALNANGALWCAARVQSKDMFDRGFFDHTNPDGELPWDRMDRAGYSWTAAGENIAQGSPTAADVMAGWMASDGHCSNIMSPTFEDIGVGYYDGALWTQTFGAQ